MRKAQKQDLLNIIETLHEAHEEIKKLIEAKKYAEAQDLLAQCQECAVTVGNAIEASEKEGFITVSYIEEYCNILYPVYEELNTHINAEAIIGNSTGTGINANKVYKKLKRQLLKIESSVKNDVPIRKEIVFFPYKASMWDSLESIYLAAKEDDTCDAYCVPIPYYDLNPDRSFGAFHYEGREYPKNIEVIDWQTYHFEERRPDIIYIHNPYDNWNMVTSVPERFYSSNLKKYTDELIYVPYFVLNEIEPDNQPAIDNMKHFCFLPGTILADKVILQSEKMSQIYVNEYRKKALEEGLGGTHVDETALKKKFLGLGSPKFDKVLRTKKEDVEVPKEWLSVIEKPDGTWKKIIFYNTTVTALLQYNEQMLAKIKDVFRIFYENKDEVALLWRPHPLYENTIKSMRSQLWEEYKEIVDNYKAEGWGIYDDTTDMDRAIALSDAYYGDESSVVQLYQKTGKPVMVQACMNLEMEDIFSYLPFDGGVCYKDKILCIHRKHKAIYSIDLNTFSVEYESKLVSAKEERSYIRNYEYKNKIYMIPGKEEAVVEYNPESDEYENYSYGERNNNVNKFYSTVGYEDKLYLFPMREKFILKIELATKIVDKIVLPIRDQELFRQYGYFIKRHVVIEKKLLIPCACENLLLIMDLESTERSWKKICCCDCGFQDIVEYEGHVYLLDRNRNIYCVKPDDYSVEKKVCQLEQHYEYMVVCGKELVLIPKYMNAIAFWNPQTNEVMEMKYPLGFRFIDTKMITFSDICYAERKVYLIPRACNMMISVDKNTKEVAFEKWHIGEKTKEYLSREMTSEVAVGNTLEESIYSLGRLMAMLKEY